MAGMAWVGRLGAEPGKAVEHRRIARDEIQVVGELLAAHYRPVAPVILLESPVTDPDAGSIRGESGPAEADPGRALVMAQATKRRIGDGGVG